MAASNREIESDELYAYGPPHAGASSSPPKVAASSFVVKPIDIPKLLVVSYCRSGLTIGADMLHRVK